jgi:hypothetical protein
MTSFKSNPVTDADLMDFDEVFEDSEAEPRDFESVPDGKYQVAVEQVELVRTHKGDPMLKWMLRVLGPTCAGRVIWRNNVLASPENVSWLKKDLYACDLRLKKLSELPAHLGELLDIQLEITKRTRGDFESTYINKRIRSADEAGKPAAPTGPRKPEGKSAGKAREALSKF